MILGSDHVKEPNPESDERDAANDPNHQHLSPSSKHVHLHISIYRNNSEPIVFGSICQVERRKAVDTVKHQRPARR